MLLYNISVSRVAWRTRGGWKPDTKRDIQIYGEKENESESEG